MRIAIYGRVSSEKQEKQATINSQLEALRKFAKKNNYIIFKEYTDDGFSGELLARPALDDLRDDAKKSSFELVLVHSPDRLSRKFIYKGLIEEELKKSGIKVLYLNAPDSKDTPEDILLSNVQGIIAEYEKSKILERTRRGRVHKAKSGFIVTSQPPYGYNYIKMDRNRNIMGHYEINPKEAKVVKLIFDLFVNKGLSIRAVAKELTRLKIYPQRGKQWRTSSLHRIIRNETYAGVFHYNKHKGVEPANVNDGKYRRLKNSSLRLRPKEEWIPISISKELRIVDRKMFDKAQKQLKINLVKSPRNVKNQYLLRGFVKCNKCDSPYYGDSYHGVLYYRCGNRHRAFPLPKNCSMGSIKTDTLDTVVWDKFCDAIKNPRLILEQVEKLKDKDSKSKKSIERDVEFIEKEINDTSIEESRLLDAFREGILSMEQLKEQMTKIRENKEQLEREKQELITKKGGVISKSSTQKTIKDYCKQVEKRLDSLKDDFTGKRYLLNLALNKIVYEGNKVRIKCIIPAYTPQVEETPASFGCITSPIACYYERNTAIEYELVASLP